MKDASFLFAEMKGAKKYPNAENMKWGIVGSNIEMTFDEFVRYCEDENKKWVESNRAYLEEQGLWEYVKENIWG